MNLRIFLRVLNKNKWILLTFLLVGLASSALWLRTQPTTYQSAISIVANYSNTQAGSGQPTYFQYDNYYGTLVAQAFNASIPALLKNDGVVKEIYDKAGFDFSSLKNPGKYFRTTPKSQNVSEIRLEDKDRTKVNRLSNTLITVLQTKAKEFSETRGEGNLVLGIEGPTIMEVQTPVVIYGAILLIFFLTLGIIWALLSTYLQNETYDSDEIRQVVDLPYLGQLRLYQESKSNLLPYLTLREKILTVNQSTFSGVRIGFLGFDLAATNTIAKNIETYLREQQPTTIVDLTHTPPQVMTKKLIEMNKNTKEAQLVLFPSFLNPNLSLQAEHALDCRIVCLPLNGISRDALQSAKNLIVAKDKIPAYTLLYL
jgi:capsular polysaccharide biosynthesis protein